MDSMKNIGAVLVFVLSFLCMSMFSAGAAEERYIITTRDGSTIVAKEYRFTDKYVEYTTENGLQGYIKREEFAAIANMVGVPPGETERVRQQVNKEERRNKLWMLAAALLTVLFAVLLVYLGGKRKSSSRDEADIYYGQVAKEPTTQGHLSFEYKGSLGRTAKYTIEVRSAYEEDGVLYVEGICTATDKRKKFRADRIVGPVTDMSSNRHAPMEQFFVTAKQDG